MQTYAQGVINGISLQYGYQLLIVPPLYA